MSFRDKDYSIQHSIQRFEERYGKIISKNQYNILVEVVRNYIRENKFITGVNKVSKTNTQYVVNFIYENVNIIATFETERDCITTFLPYKKFS